MEQEPGPRGSPQLPQAPEGIAEAEEDDDPFAETAKTESWGARLLLWHFGQEAFSFPITRASKRWSHSLQEYSKIGMTIRVVCSTGYTTNLENFYSCDLIPPPAGRC